MRGRLERTAVLVALMLVVSSVSVAAYAGEGASSADDALDTALEKLVTRKNGPPGIAVVVQRNGDPELHAAGLGDVEAGTPPAIDDHVRVASVAKAFSGGAALSAVADGVLSLDDTIGARLPDLPSTWSEITLRQLLGHTSGIPDFSKTSAFQDAVRASLEVAPAPVELLVYVADEPLEFDPGSEYQYSNSDNIVVGLMLEAATGQPYADALQARVAVPLGLTGTSLPTGIEIADPLVHGYAVDPPDPPEDVTEVIAGGWSWASGAVVATPADSNAFIRGYASGATTNEATHEAQLDFVRGGRSEPPGPGKNSAGLAIFRYRTRCGTVYGHTGNTLGYTHFIAATPDGQRSTSVSVNAQITPNTNPKRFPELRKVFELAVCAALAD